VWTSARLTNSPRPSNRARYFHFALIFFGTLVIFCYGISLLCHLRNQNHVILPMRLAYAPTCRGIREQNSDTHHDHSISSLSHPCRLFLLNSNSLVTSNNSCQTYTTSQQARHTRDSDTSSPLSQCPLAARRECTSSSFPYWEPSTPLAPRSRPERPSCCP
jgi:hypothetical protein